MHNRCRAPASFLQLPSSRLILIFAAIPIYSIHFIYDVMPFLALGHVQFLEWSFSNNKNYVWQVSSVLQLFHNCIEELSTLQYSNWNWVQFKFLAVLGSFMAGNVIDAADLFELWFWEVMFWHMRFENERVNIKQGRQACRWVWSLPETTGLFRREGDVEALFGKNYCPLPKKSVWNVLRNCKAVRNTVFRSNCIMPRSVWYETLIIVFTWNKYWFFLCRKPKEMS